MSRYGDFPYRYAILEWETLPKVLSFGGGFLLGAGIFLQISQWIYAQSHSFSVCGESDRLLTAREANVVLGMIIVGVLSLIMGVEVLR